MRSAAGAVVAGLLCLFSTIALANGRLPGATGLALHPSDERQLLLGLTYGLALTRDGGASWTWMCEEQIEGNGGDVDPSIVMTSDGTLVVLSLTNGGVLWSRNDGCTFERAMGPLQGNRGVDLTLDASRPGHVLALMSTIVEVLDAGVPRSATCSRTRSITEGAGRCSPSCPMICSRRPSRSRPPARSASTSGGLRARIRCRASWSGAMMEAPRGRTTTELPRGSGSLYLSGIHPHDPDRIWLRVPGRGDIYGALPARLLLTTDTAVTFQQIAQTERGMLGFAVSPEGDRIAFGGPLDGLFVAPADASEAPEKVSDVRVGCLRWQRQGLYVCASEPVDPYSLGFAAEPTEGFAPLWRRADTCRGACSPDSTIELKCQQPWEAIAPLTGAEKELCDVGPIETEAIVGAGTVVRDAAVDVGPPVLEQAPIRSSDGCAAARVGKSDSWCWLALLLILRRRQRPDS